MPRKGKKSSPSPKRRKNRKTPPSQINEPFEESKRPIGQHGSTGRPPLMKK